MRFLRSALFMFIARTVANPAPTVHSYRPSGRSGISNSQSLTQSTNLPQITPNVPASKIEDGRYTLSPAPDQCTQSFMPYQTTFWVSSSQMDIVDSTDHGWWGPKTPTDWTFSTNTSGVWFSHPYWIQDGHNPALNLKPRAVANSFTLTMDQTGEIQFLI